MPKSRSRKGQKKRGIQTTDNWIGRGGGGVQFHGFHRVSCCFLFYRFAAVTLGAKYGSVPMKTYICISMQDTFLRR